MPESKRPSLKAATDGHRIVIRFKTSSRGLFADVLTRVRAMPGAKFDWDEKVWHLPMTKPNCDRVLALKSVADVDIAPALGAWIADRSILERVTALEAAVARLERENGELTERLCITEGERY